MTILTLDLGTSATKAALWSDQSLIVLTRASLTTGHPRPGWAEQDPDTWWRSVVDACAELRRRDPVAYSAVDRIGCAAARETFACFDSNLHPLGPGILWSDARAIDEAREFGDPQEFRHRTGVVLAPSCCAAKMRWIQVHEADRFRETAWFLSPRDYVIGRLTGRAVTDPTLASRTGMFDLHGNRLGDDAVSARLPPVVSPLEGTPVAHRDELALPPRVVAILGAGDRACEVIGAGANPTTPMVSWGTTANVSVPHPGPVDALPGVAQASRGAMTGFVLEAGLSAAGAALDWLASLTGWSRGQLVAAAAPVPPGANGLLAYPWFNGARAPWWRPDIRASFVGLAAAHGPAELARSVIEGIALDAARSVDLLASHAEAVSLAGRGAEEPLWRTIIAATAGIPVVRRRLTEAASVGARWLVGASRDEPLGLEEFNPVNDLDVPDPNLIARYAELREQSDRLASRLLDAGP